MQVVALADHFSEPDIAVDVVRDRDPVFDEVRDFHVAFREDPGFVVRGVVFAVGGRNLVKTVDQDA